MTILWVGCCFGFVADEVLTPLANWRTAVFLMLDVAWVALALLTVRQPMHILGVLAMLAVTFVATVLVNGLSVTFWANGVRDFLGLVLAYPVMCYFMGNEQRRRHFEPTLERHMLYFLLVQAVCVTFQFVKYGAGDHCGGSFGNWFSGQVSMCIYIASFYLVHKRIDPAAPFASLRQCKLPIILLYPTFLNETKVSFLLLALYFLLLMPLDRRYVVRVMWIIPGVLLLGWLAVTVYLSVVGSDDDVFSAEYLTEYVSVDDIDSAEGGAQWQIEEEGMAADVPRLTKIMYLAILQEQEPGHELMGWGVGQFKGGNGLDISEFAYEYDWLLSGSVPYVFHVYIQLGTLGVVLVIVWLVLLLLVPPAWSDGRDYNVQLMVVLLLCIIMFYNDSLRNLWLCLFLFSLLASSWRPKEEVTS